jgi:large subunit ribosomal protein L6
MSKIGRKPIDINGLQIDIKGQEIHYKGKKASGVHVLPDFLKAEVKDNTLVITAKSTRKGLSAREINRDWGLNRALLFNKLKGAQAEFERQVQINGLGFKAAVSGSKVVFSLGYSHKIDFDLPQGVTLEVDKSGQKLLFKSADKELVGQVCSKVRSLRAPEPYKGTGIRVGDEVIVRKAGKTKAS